MTRKLVTLKAVKALQKCDTVVYDSLVSEELRSGRDRIVREFLWENDTNATAADSLKSTPFS